MTRGQRQRAMSAGLLLLRLGAGLLLFFGHGWPKLANYVERAPNFANPIGLGPEVSFALVVFAETACAFLVAIGAFTRGAVIPLIGFFTIAGFIQHAQDPFRQKELAFVYGVVYLVLFFTGPGGWSLDAWWAGRRGANPPDLGSSKQISMN